MVWLQVSAQKINKSNICAGKLMRLAFIPGCTGPADMLRDPSLNF